jgi:hypothetical protein
MSGSYAAGRAVARAAERLPGLRRVPVMKLVAFAEVARLAREHIERLEPHERRRVVLLLKQARGRASNLSRRERDELSRLVAKAEPRVFAGHAADMLSPVPLPKRVIEGPEKRSAQ